VIEAFGSFVMGGNFIIGLIVFGILVIVNFVVITKGSGRIAEVAARFTLDAMPGKQMAIDADLSAGLIDEETAKTRRKELEDESSFFGAMDGASKFVRGDAIAGLMITFINIIGGIVIGVAQMDMSFGDAGRAYTLLTVGDGLVSQIPALIVSTAAGLLVSKAGVTGAADKALMTQLSGYPKALGMSSFVMVVLAMLPGIPLLPFLGLAGGAGYLAWRSAKKAKDAATEVKAQEVLAKATAEAPPAEEPISKSLRIDDLRIELGYGLLGLIDDGEGADRLTEQIKALRRSLASELGFVMPSVRLLDNMQIGANTYVVKVKEVEAGTGEVFSGQFMTMNPTGGAVELPGRETTEPTFGLPATWIEGKFRDQAEIKGYTVVDPATVISTHLTEIIKGSTADLLSYADTQNLINELPPPSRNWSTTLCRRRFRSQASSASCKACSPSAFPSAICRPFWKALPRPAPLPARRRRSPNMCARAWRFKSAPRTSHPPAICPCCRFPQPGSRPLPTPWLAKATTNIWRWRRPNCRSSSPR
jgi:flagellar biosynthesis protein FlhA